MEYRDDLIDAYFDALDDAEYAPLESVFTSDVTYRMPSETVEGKADLMDYFRNHRLPSRTTHDISLRIHDTDASAVEGDVTGELTTGGDFGGPFVDVFVFDDDRRRIDRMSVYSSFDIPSSDRD